MCSFDSCIHPCNHHPNFCHPRKFPHAPCRPVPHTRPETPLSTSRAKDEWGPTACTLCVWLLVLNTKPVRFTQAVARVDRSSLITTEPECSTAPHSALSFPLYGHMGDLRFRPE